VVIHTNKAQGPVWGSPGVAGAGRYRRFDPSCLKPLPLPPIPLWPL